MFVVSSSVKTDEKKLFRMLHMPRESDTWSPFSFWRGPTWERDSDFLSFLSCCCCVIIFCSRFKKNFSTFFEILAQIRAEKLKRPKTTENKTKKYAQ